MNHPRIFALWTTVTLLTLTTSSASALDGYQDRRGLFLGVGVGAGLGAAATDAQEQNGLDDGRRLGMHVNALVGGGATERLVLAAQGNMWRRTVSINDFASAHTHLSANAVANYFILDGLFLEAGAGLAYGSFDTFVQGQSSSRYREMGLATKAGAGFEFFVNSQTAIGAHFGYTRHFYARSNFDTLNLNISARWY
ncbi:MAG: outer membrane beta-barrel protein [Myxococcota bacterium]